MKKTTFKSIVLLGCIFAHFFSVQSQVPNGYYSAADGKKGSTLKTSLYQIISSHTALSYKALWEAFKTTDVRSDGKIWDMYSSETNYTPGGSAQGANYSAEGDSYNREHSFPKSWFNAASPMYTDLFHIYPTDGYVNNRRSNYPFGETEGEEYQSENGFSKLGNSTLSGYSGTVFEPADEYKGDFARSYFYMATAYEDKIASWSSAMLSGNSYTAFATWALDMLLRWSEEDPVSEKEINRNNAVYNLQKNRNPFIDFPGLEQYIWGDKTSIAFDSENYTSGSTVPDETSVVAPVFSPSSGAVKQGTKVSISSETEGTSICYTINDGNTQINTSPVEITINEASTITAYALLGEKKSETVTATYTITTDTPTGSNIYQLITSDKQLISGSQILIVCQNELTAMANQDDDIRNYVEVTISSDYTITTDVNVNDMPYSFVLGGGSGAWTLYDQVENVYLAHTATKNKIYTAATCDEETAKWNIYIESDSTATIQNKKNTSYSIQYNASAPRFACYKSNQQPVSIFSLLKSDQIEEILTQSEENVKVYNLRGQLLKSSQSAIEVIRNLPRGIYIINGKKYFIQ